MTSELNNLFSLLATYGVPIILSVYLVYWITNKLNSKLDKLVNAVQELNNNILKLSERLENLKEIVKR